MNYNENKRFIESVPLFSILTMNQREAIITSLSILKYADQQHIVNEGDPGDLFYILKEGVINCYQGGRQIRTMQRGEFFGE